MAESWYEIEWGSEIAIDLVTNKDTCCPVTKGPAA